MDRFGLRVTHSKIRMICGFWKESFTLVINAVSHGHARLRRLIHSEDQAPRFVGMLTLKFPQYPAAGAVPSLQAVFREDVNIWIDTAPQIRDGAAQVRRTSHACSYHNPAKRSFVVFSNPCSSAGKPILVENLLPPP